MPEGGTVELSELEMVPDGGTVELSELEMVPDGGTVELPRARGGHFTGLMMSVYLFLASSFIFLCSGPYCFLVPGGRACFCYALLH